MGLKAEWSLLRRRPCEGCGDLYKPVRPDQRFCSTKCRLDFHHHGGAYVKLKPLVEKLVAKRTAELARELKDRIAKLEAALHSHAA